jgi:ABC-type antimicrobial peptide transport system permease subunit
VVDQILADRHDLTVGDDIEILGGRFRIVGLSRDTASFMTGFVFITHDAANGLLRQPSATTAVLIGTDDPAGVRSRLEGDGLTVLDTADLHQAGVALATRIYGTPLRLMVTVAFAAGTLIIALTAYTLIAEHRREYGIIKAMGATGARLTRLAIAQTAMVAAVGLAAGFVLFVAGRFAIVTARPQFAVLLTPGAALRATVAAFAMAALAAVIPARRLSRIDPAAAYGAS